MWNRTLLLASVLTIGVMTGCAARATYATGYVAAPPPAPRVEVYGVAPGPGFVWVQGFWNWGGGGYAWVPGYWARPPHRHARWAPGYWQRRHGGYYYHRGYWR
ncbi:MAG TPA: hypothetical protein VEU62_18220 [Bryobacterales bacterium]|nr:hypothetical protein [Bryobacterales bacterium]